MENSDRNKNTLALSFIAYGGFYKTSTGNTEIAKALRLFESVIGDQELVWGPAVHKSGIFQDALMFVVYSRNEIGPEYTVVIRGTNPVSLKTWIFQDLMVHKLVDWNNGDDLVSGRKISQGTSTGLTILKQLKPPEGFPGENRTALEFLTEAACTSSTPLTVTLTGHSLGAALAPVYGLYLKENLTATNVQLQMYTYASPSIGNQPFADYINTVFNGCSFRYTNPLDVVTNVWNQNDVKKIMFLYRWIIPFTLSPALLWVFLQARNKGYTHIHKEFRVESNIIAGLLTFELQMVYQHIVPYIASLIDLCDEKSFTEMIHTIEQGRFFKKWGLNRVLKKLTVR